nr:sensor domain-containing protein [Mycobacterium sp.]
MDARASRFRRRLSVARRALAGLSAVPACSAVVLSACSNPPPKAAVPPTAHEYADKLIVGLDDVRRITNFEGLQRYSYADRHRPFQGNQSAPGPCGAVGSTEQTFPMGWKNYRAVAYSGTTDDLRPFGISPINQISQAVAIYRDAHAASAALDRLETILNACAALHDKAYEFDMSRSDPSTLKLTSARWSHLYRAKSSVLMSVGVLGIEPTEQIAYSPLQKITDRIK